MLEKIKKITILALPFFIFGCGADSDLLRDQNTNDTPTGSAYETLSKGIYVYKRNELNQLGFDYFILDEECTKTKCTLLHNDYIIFDGNITQQSPKKHIVLNKNGWYEKSQENECTIVFNDTNMTEKCPDGRNVNLNFKENTLSSKKLLTYDTALIVEADLKDSSAAFNESALLYETTLVNETTLYELTDDNTTKCYDATDSTLHLSNADFSTYKDIECQENEYIVSLTNVMNQSGSATIVNKNTNEKTITTWKIDKVYENYNLIKVLGKIPEDTMFIAFYNGYIRIGKVILEEQKKNFLNKDAFNAIYTQLADKYTTKSLVVSDLKNNVYQLDMRNATNIYIKYGLLDTHTVSKEYGAFFDTAPEGNWILTDQGLHRESESCDSSVLFNTYLYTCDDGRVGEFTRVKENDLKEKLIYTYLLDNKVNYNLENNDTFFSVGAKEITYRKKSEVDTYIFNPTTSLSVGTKPLEDNRTALFGESFYISSYDKKYYIEILNPTAGTSGVGKVFTLKDGIELNTTTENNSTFVENNLKEIDTLAWEQTNIGKVEIIKVVLTPINQQRFSLKDNIILTTFDLSKQKIIVGEVLESKLKTVDLSYLNFEGFKNIESAVIEK